MGYRGPYGRTCRLSEDDIANAPVCDPGKMVSLNDGGGLFLICGHRQKRWYWKFTLEGTHQAFSIGLLSDVSLAEARIVTEYCRALVSNGINPNDRRKKDRAFGLGESVEHMVEYTDKNSEHREQYKECTACKETKPRTEFYRKKAHRDGLNSECKSCMNGFLEVYRNKNRDRMKLKRREWDAARGGYGRRHKYLTKYGITPEQYDGMLAAQGGRCAICRSDEPGGNSAEYFKVDHDHKTGAVRGLLCGHCNSGLGMFRDDVGTVRAAVGYLESSIAGQEKVAA